MRRHDDCRFDVLKVHRCSDAIADLPPRPQCYLFHMYVGVRAGGGIGDEIEDPAGDPYELYRILFDITFFFFVIVILLAIIQGEFVFMTHPVELLH